MRARRAAPLSALVLCCAITACGRRATQADCDLILDRYVEVQLRDMNITDPATVTEQKTKLKNDMKDELRDCVGKRVTDSMLSCVKKAQSNDEIDKCVR